MTEFNERKVIRNRPVVRELDRNSTLELRWPILIGFVFAGLMCVYSWQQHRTVEYGYRVEALKKESAQLEEARRKLTLEQAVLESPARVYQLAQDKLGLAAPAVNQVIFETALEAGRIPQRGALAMGPSQKSGAQNSSNETLRSQ